MPRQRLMQRLTRHRRLAGWVLARHAPAARIARASRLARFVGLMPERRAAARSVTFRPRFLRAIPSGEEIAPWYADDAALVTREAEPALPWEEPRIASALSLSPADNAAWKPVDEAIAMSPVEEPAAVPPVARDTTAAPPPPIARVPPAAPSRADAHGQEAAPRVPEQPMATPPRERMGRRISEEPLRPVAAPVEPAPLAPSALAVPPARPAEIAPPIPEPTLRAVADTPSPATEEPGTRYRAVETAAALPMEPEPIVRSQVTPAMSDDAGTPAPLPPAAEDVLPDVRDEGQAGVPAEAVARAASETPDVPPEAPASPESPAVPLPESSSAAMIAEVLARLARPDPPTGMGQRAEPAGRDDTLISHAPSQPAPIVLPGEPVSPQDTPTAGQPNVGGRKEGIAPPDEPAIAATPEAFTADNLFLSRGTDRSVAAWVARLTGEPLPTDAAVAAAPPVAAPDTERPATAPPIAPEAPRAGRATDEPMPPAPRRFVAPVVEPPRPAVASPPDRVATDTPVVPGADALFAGAERITESVGQEAATTRLPEPVTEPYRDDTPVAATIPPLDATEIVSAETLFLARGTDRSVGSWIERLTGGARPDVAPPSATAPSPASAPVPSALTPPPITAGTPARPAMRPTAAVRPSMPTPVAETTRRFLRPLVGIDPGSVPLHRDADAAAVAGAYRADALTDGNVTLLAAGHAADTPETLGLLAHELTHVARRRDARFVPPIARAADRNDQSPAGAVSATSATAFLADDEALARRVEARVVRAARAYRAAKTPFSAPVGGGPAEADDDDAPFAPEPRNGAERRESDAWNGLPAPWEPLPGWADAPATESLRAMNGAMNGAPSPISAAPPAPVAPVVQLAAEGHESDGAAPATTPAQRDTPNAPVEPDLDALARQVYGILKQRLVVEGQRFG